MIQAPVWEFESQASGQTRNAFSLAGLRRFREKADINQPTRPAKSVENDPKATLCRFAISRQRRVSHRAAAMSLRPLAGSKVAWFSASRAA